MFYLASYILMSLSLPDAAQKILDASPAAVHQLAYHRLSLDDREPDKYVNQVFKDNILLSLAYLQGVIKDGDKIDWSKIESPTHYELTLNPGQVFAFHDQVLPEYQDKVAITTHSYFGFSQGFKSDGYLPGDGVCHLASLFNWTAQDANLSVNAPTRHDFATIADVPKEYGVSIYAQPNTGEVSTKQNLYITNNHKNPIKFIIDYNQNQVSLAIDEL